MTNPIDEQLEQIEQLARKIADITVKADADPNVVFSALQSVFTFWMSTVCADCRNDVAHQLKADIPLMVNAASQLAAWSSNPVRH
jgi:hypothetical protein